MKLTDTLKRRFCRDNNLSIQVYSEPYFSDRVELLGKTNKLRRFERLITETFDDNEQKYNNYYNMLKDLIINYIKESEAFKTLNQDDMSKYAVKSDIRQGDIFKERFIGSELISIDMSKANFSSLVYYGKETGTNFHNNYSWRSFMYRFTSFDYFTEPKYIRQVIFGNCNPKKQVTYEKYIMNKVIKQIEENTSFKESELLAYCNDEIIFSVAGHTEDEIRKLKAEVNILSESIIPLRFEHFVLGKVSGTDAYVKKFIDDIRKYELKCADPSDTIFAIRCLNKEDIKENDLVFIQNHRLAKYLETPEIEISYKQSNT